MELNYVIKHVPEIQKVTITVKWWNNKIAEALLDKNTKTTKWLSGSEATTDKNKYDPEKVFNPIEIVHSNYLKTTAHRYKT